MSDIAISFAIFVLSVATHLTVSYFHVRSTFSSCFEVNNQSWCGVECTHVLSAKMIRLMDHAFGG